MATASELLLAQEEPHFIISEDLRTIAIPYGQSVIGVFSDENVRRIWFDMPDTCDGTDLSDFQITINYINALNESGRYYVTDAIVADGTITFSWLVSRAVCASDGQVQFVVCLRLFDTDNETILKEFNTTVTTMNVLIGIEAELEITDPQKDAVNSVIGPAAAAANSANAAGQYARAAAAEALDAAEDTRDLADEATVDIAAALSGLDDATDRAEAAIAAVGDISELAVPLMSADVRGGAKLGQGLVVDSDVLSLGNLVESGEGAEVLTQGCAIYEVTGEGWTEQDTTIGKNLAYVEILSSDSSGLINTDIATIAAGEYTFSATGIETVALSIRSNPGNVYITGINLTAGNRNQITFSVDAEATIRIYKGSLTANTTYANNIQLEAGSTATSFEPYTGGAPSPSPDYPQEIRVARGRNLLEPTNVALYRGGNGLLVNDSSNAVSYIAHVSRNTDYVVSYNGGNRSNVIGTGSTVPAIGVAGDYIRNTQVQVSPFTFNSGENDYVLVQLGYNPDSAVSEQQLELGTTPTPFVPYGYVGLEVHGRNLFDQSVLSKVSGVIISSDGYTANASSFHAFGVIPISVEGQVSLSLDARWNGSIGTGNGLAVSIIYNDGTSNIRYIGTSTNAWQRIEIISDSSKVAVSFRFGYVTNASCTVNNVQLESGGTVHSFQPYTHTVTPIPLPSKGFAASLPNGTADTLSVDSAGRYEWVCSTDEVVFDGSSDENWKYETTSQGGSFYVFMSNAIAPSYGNSLLLTHAKSAPSASVLAGAAYISQSKNLNMTIGDQLSITTAADFKTWLASNNVTLLYPLANPTTESGYIDLPALPDGSTVSCPELHEIGVSWFVSGVDELAKHAANWGKRALESESRIAALEAAVAELATSTS